MILNQETLRFIFGIKLRNLRLERKYSLKELAKSSGLSPSYINEIEKGKKYPKSDKIVLLANSLGVSYDDLISIQLNNELNSISKILQGDLLKNIPFDMFGLPAQNIFELVAESPNEFSALIGSFLELARLYDIRVEDFFYATLRAYLDRNLNWMGEIEQAAAKERTQIPDVTLENLRRRVTTKVQETKFDDPLLHKMHFVRGSKKEVFFNADLSEREKSFLYARERGFEVLGLKDLANTSEIRSVDSFEQVFNNFQGSYFASSLLVPKEEFSEDLRQLFSLKKWDNEKFARLMMKYPGTIENCFHRLSQILPRYFQMNRLFMLKMSYSRSTGKFKLIRELHLSNLHSPHSVKSDQHYCRRWITTKLIQQYEAQDQPYLAGSQISNFFQKEQQYLCFSMAFPDEIDDDAITGITLGIELNELARRQIEFVDDTLIERREVSSTCEQCLIRECKERVANAVPEKEAESDRELSQAIEKLIATQDQLR